MKKLAFTVIGPDRPGIVAELSGIITKCGGNWLESHMANLAGQFAGIVELDVADDKLDELCESLRSQTSGDLQVVIANTSPESNEQSRSVGFEIVGKDHPGIVRDITECVAKCNAGIEVFQTELFSASMSGEEMFKAVLHIRVPETVSIDDVQTALENVSQDLMMDLVVDD